MSKQMTNSARRAFLSTAVVGGIGVASFRQASAAAPAQAVGGCTRLLITDLLKQDIQRLDQVLSAVFAALYESVSITLDECKAKYEKLYVLANQLDDDLRLMCQKQPASPQVVELQDLNRAWRANMQLVSSGLPLAAPEAARLMMVTRALDQQLCEKVEQLLPADAEVELSEGAKMTLRSIIEAVRSPDFLKFHREVLEHNSYTEKARGDIELKDRVRRALISAQDKMALAENPDAEAYLAEACKKAPQKEKSEKRHVHPAAPAPADEGCLPTTSQCAPGALDRTALRRESVACLRAAIDDLKVWAGKGGGTNWPLSKLEPEELKQLPDSFLASGPLDIDQTAQKQGLDPNPNRELTALDSLLLSLSGHVRLVCGSAPGGCDAAPRSAALGGDAMGFEPVGERIAAPAPDNLRSDIVPILRRRCGDDSRGNVDACEANIRNVRTWRFGRRTGLSALTRFDLQFGNIHCLPWHDVDALVRELAALI